MANAETRADRPRIFFLNGMDGVLVKAPFPVVTARKLIGGDLGLPEARPVKEDFSKPNPVVLLAERLHFPVISHSSRAAKPDTLIGLEAFRNIAGDQGRDLTFGVLTGRTREKHDLTRRQLEEMGYMEYFNSHNLFLNPGKSSIDWKVKKAEWYLYCGYNVVHIDDDLRPILSIARLEEQFKSENGHRVLLYLVNNISNHPRLLKRAGIELPENVVRVNSHIEAASDFEARVIREEI